MSRKNQFVLAAYNHGRHAYGIGQAVNACPYPQSKEYRAAWERGWFEAQRKFDRANQKWKREIDNLRKGS